MDIQKVTINDAISRLFAKYLNDGFRLEAIHNYTDANGEVLYHRIRLKKSSTNEKIIRPLRHEDNIYVLGEPKFNNKKPLYNLPQIIKRSNEPIYFCEGEWCVDTINQLGCLATTSGGANSIGTVDLEPLMGRELIIWPDNDEAGIRYADDLITALQGFSSNIKLIDVDKLNLPKKGDVVDWMFAHPIPTKETIESLPYKIVNSNLIKNGKKNFASNNKDFKEKDKPHSEASYIVEFVTEHAELFFDSHKETYAYDLLTHETRNLEGRQFKSWLVSNYYEAHDKTPREHSIREAIETLKGLAQFKGELHDVFIRVAIFDGVYYLDLGEKDKNRAICISPGSWKILDDHPIRFVRSDAMLPLPVPLKGGSMNTLWQMVNIPENMQLLVLAWLIDCLRPETPFPLLELVGEQGSAKSTTQEFLRQLIDPNSCNLRASPKSDEDVYIAGGMNWLVSYENISYLPQKIQDALCVLSTGGGYAKRKLYSNADETYIKVKRPVVLNGICASITSQDLIDRTISIETPLVEQRVESNQLRHSFSDNHSQMLGALLDIFANSLAILPSIDVPKSNCPRLIEFVKLGMAISKVIGQSDFLKAFNLNRSEAIARTIEASPIASAIIEMVSDKREEPLSMPLKYLLHRLEKYSFSSSDNWPRTPKGLGDALRRAAPALRQMGISCKSLGKQGSYVNWEIKSI
ncbi:TPA: hypothetical protein RGI49_000833 [Legionella pneumophila]|nr:hypothetical protein [Legionella pneumophila]HAT9433966.1 hypothetical protein [Legionella pneumophila subsp. pneumophila]MDW9069289.1 hypothetical protein [Legionella pneumophila]MDW9091389.1 hypothetical protein [Legionella pneumophila]MDW9094364.1 hypothetical protein [Legionella pneumophila]